MARKCGQFDWDTASEEEAIDMRDELLRALSDDFHGATTFSNLCTHVLEHFHQFELRTYKADECPSCGGREEVELLDQFGDHSLFQERGSLASAWDAMYGPRVTSRRVKCTKPTCTTKPQCLQRMVFANMPPERLVLHTKQHLSTVDPFATVLLPWRNLMDNINLDRKVIYRWIGLVTTCSRGITSSYWLETPLRTPEDEREFKYYDGKGSQGTEAVIFGGMDLKGEFFKVDYHSNECTWVYERVDLASSAQGDAFWTIA
jgi:hypothetical protein